MAEFRPFADDAAHITIGDLGIENGSDRVMLAGELAFPKDRDGLARAAALKAAIDAIHAALVAEGDALPDHVNIAPRATTKIKNPFG